MHFLGKYLYKAIGSNTWGEHEMDYAFATKLDYEFECNPDSKEVNAIFRLERKEYEAFVKKTKAAGHIWGRWYEHIADNVLNEVWDCVEKNDLSSLSQKYEGTMPIKEAETIIYQ